MTNPEMSGAMRPDEEIKRASGARCVTQPEKCEFLGIRVDALTVRSLFAVSAAAVASHQQLVIANHNMHSLYLHRRSRGMRRFFDQADYVFADGMWIVHLARLFKQPLRQEHRITSLDWLDPFLRMAERSSWRVFFLGGTASVAARFEQHIRSTYAALSSGHYDGYFDMRTGSADNKRILAHINAFSPHILIVCMGMPRQEAWICANRSRLAANVIFPLGGIMDYLVGETAMPPRWTGPSGVEWMYRLLHDPKRLAGRYIWEPIYLAPWIVTAAFRGWNSRHSHPSTTGGIARIPADGPSPSAARYRD